MDTHNCTPPLEQQAQLAADAWRILGHLGLVDTIFNHISAVALNQTGDLHMIINPDGILPREISPECLCVIPLREYLPSEAASLGVNPDGLRLHSLIHSVRVKPGVIIHTHSIYCVAVGCSEQGLLPLSQTAMEFVGDLEVVEYDGVFRSQGLTEQLKSLASRGGAALLRNHGALVVADSVQEATYLSYYLEEACRIQVITLSQGSPIILPAAANIVKARKALRSDRIGAAARLFEALRRKLEV